MEPLVKLQEAILNMDQTQAAEEARRALEAGVSFEAIAQGVAKIMELVGERWERGELFIPEVIACANAVAAAMDAVKAQAGGELGSVTGKRPVKVVLGTVRGDLHDIGKNLVKLMLESAGYEVIDLGVDVPCHRFVSAVRESGASVVGMSALLTTTRGEMKNVIDALAAEGLRAQTKVIVGGACVNEEFASFIGADGYGAVAMDAVKLCDRLLRS